MNPFEQYQQATRREFLTTSASGLGGIALGSMLAQDGILNAATAKDPAGFAELMAPLIGSVQQGGDKHIRNFYCTL